MLPPFALCTAQIVAVITVHVRLASISQYGRSPRFSL